MLKQVKEHLKKSGRLKPSQAHAVIDASPILQSLLNIKRLVFASGAAPFPDGEWVHLCSGQEIKLCETADPPFVKADNPETLDANRREMLGEMLRAIEAAFVTHTSNADPQRWQMVCLRGEFLRETVVALPAGEVGIYLDVTFAFKPVEAHEKSTGA